MATYTFWLDMGYGSWSIGITKSGGGTGQYDFSCEYSININGQTYSGVGRYDFRTWSYDQQGSMTIASGSYSVRSGNNTGSGVVDGVAISDSYYYNPPQPTYTHTITYDANGGSNPPPAQSLSSHTQGSFSATLSSAIPTRSGYEFKGWVISGQTSPIYYPSASYTFNSQNVTLKAVWEGGAFIKLSGQWKIGTLYQKINGLWKAGKPYVKVSGEYKK